MNKLMYCVISASVMLTSCSQKPAPSAGPVPVNLFTVKSVPVVYFDRYPGTTVALSEVNLIPEVQGYITSILFKEGTHITKGERLYEIDKRLFLANDSAAEANLKVAQGNLLQAQQDADRYTYLNNNDAVAKQLYDHAMVALLNAKNQVKASEDGVKTAQTNLAYSTIVAPFDGTIGLSQVKIGNMVNVGQTVLNTISSDDPMAVDFLVNEKQLSYFENLQNGGDKGIDSLFTLILPDNTTYPSLGKISVIDRAVDPQTGSIRVRLEFPNPKYNLRPGMSCVVKVHNQDVTPQVFIPNRAVVEQMGEYFVFIAKDTSISHGNSTEVKAPSLTAIQKKVILGATVGPNVIITKGINDGDEIVVDGVQTLHNGSKITTAAPSAGNDGDNKKASK